MIMRRLRLVGLIPLLGLLVSVQPAGRAATAIFHRPIVSVAANQSNNWSGYNQGTIEQGGKMFSHVTGDWIVPTATAHTKGTAAFSSTWIGIGGGCVDASCLVTDNTLIQAGTEQDVDAAGHASYSAWWELIPAPSVPITGMPIRAGDHMHVDIGAAAPGVWSTTVKDVTTGKTFSQTLPYPSTEATAEWIEETPVVIDNNGSVSIGPLPNLSTVHFDPGTVNGANPKLKTSEEVQLVDTNNVPLATPSSPDPDTDGFNDCAYAKSCAAPTTSSPTTTSGHATHHAARKH
jgi:hypothetical protein